MEFRHRQVGYIRVVWVAPAAYPRGQICCSAMSSEVTPHSPPPGAMRGGA